MSSLRRIESSRANGAKSSGPATPEGRQAVTLNAVKHGLTAQTVILKNESSEEYQAALQRYIDHFRPQGLPEEHLVHQLAAAAWRLARYASVESGLLNDKMDTQAKWVNRERRDATDSQRVAIAFDSLAEHSPSLSLVNRYQARLHHEYQRILKSLLQIQGMRPSNEAELPNRPNPASEHEPREIQEVAPLREADCDPGSVSIELAQAQRGARTTSSLPLLNRNDIILRDTRPHIPPPGQILERTIDDRPRPYS